MLDQFSNDPAGNRPKGNDTGIVSYVMDLVGRWRQFRDGNYRDKWEAYEAIYRGEWNNKLKQKVAERSRVITPVTTNAVDQSVSEMAEAIFGRGKWFNVDEDNKSPDEIKEAEALQDQLLDDFALNGVKTAILGTLHNGAKYGTGIAKRNISSETTYTLQPDQNGETQEVPTTRKVVSWEAILPLNFVIDSSSTTVKDAHGAAHETLRPKHEIQSKIDSGEYFDTSLESASGYGSADVLNGPNGENYEKDPLDGVYITEYHGLVPRKMLTEATTKPPEPDVLDVIAEDKPAASTADDKELVEAIIIIANGSSLLKAVENPILNKDRAFIAYQHFIRPGAFWGIGVPEKGYNGQMALDAEIRARMDTLALVTYPSITADATRLPKNLNLTVTPGKVFMTNGRGSEIIEPMKFGNLDPVTFQHSQDLERYVQMATGAGDPSTAVNANRSPTATGGSMQFGSYIKRAKLPMQTVDEQFLDPLVRKSLLAYMTVDPERYPALFDYTVNSTLSIMAREFEQMQMTNLLAVIPQGSAAFNTVLKAIITNYSGPSKDEILADIEKASQPDPMQQQMQQIQMETAQAGLAKTHAEIVEIQARGQYTGSKIGTDKRKLELHDEELHIQAAQTLVDQQKSQNQAHATIISHHGNVMGALAKFHATHNKSMDAQRALAARPTGAPAQ